MNCKLDLKKIALHARNAEYNPKRFAAVIMRIREPRTTALIFSSGKMVCTGAKSEEDSRLAARKYARIIQKLGFTVSIYKVSFMCQTYLLHENFLFFWKYYVSACQDFKFKTKCNGFFLLFRLSFWTSKYKTWWEVVMSNSQYD